MWEIDWYQNEWPWLLFRGRIKVMSTVALHWTLNISKTVRDRGLIGSKGSSIANGLRGIKWSRDPERCSEAVRSAILATSWLLVIYVLYFAVLTVSFSKFTRWNTSTHCCKLFVKAAHSHLFKTTRLISTPKITRILTLYTCSKCADFDPRQ